MPYELHGFRALPASLDPRVAPAGAAAGTTPRQYDARSQGAHTPSNAAASRLKAREALAALRSPMLGRDEPQHSSTVNSTVYTPGSGGYSVHTVPPAQADHGHMPRMPSASVESHASLASNHAPRLHIETPSATPTITPTTATPRGASLRAYPTPAQGGLPRSASDVSSAAIQDEVARLSRLVVQHQQTIDEKTAEAAHATAAVRDMEVQVQRLAEENAGCMEKLAAQTELMQQLGDDTGAVEQRNHMLARQAEELQREKAAMEAAHAKELDWLRTAVAQLQTSKDEETALLSDEIQKATALHGDSAAAYAALRERLTDSAAACDALRASLRDAEAREASLADALAQSRLAEEEADARYALSQFAHRVMWEKLSGAWRQAALEGAARGSAGAAALEAGVVRRRRLQAFMKLRHYGAAKAAARVAPLQRQLEDSERERTRMALVVDLSEQHAVQAQQQLDDRMAGFQETQQRVHQLEADAVDRASLHSAVNDARETVRGLEARCEELQRELEAAVARSAALEEEKRELASARLAARASISALESAAAARGRDMEALKEEVEELTKRDAMRETQLTATETSLAGANERLKRAEERVRTDDESAGALRARLDDALALLPTCEAQRDAAKKEAAAALGRLQAAEAQHAAAEEAWAGVKDRLQDRLAHSEARARKVEAAREDAEAAVEELRNAADDLRDELRTAQRERDDEKRRGKRAEQDAEEAREDTRRAEALVEELTAERRAGPTAADVTRTQEDLREARAERDVVKKLLRTAEDEAADLRQALEDAQRDVALLQCEEVRLEGAAAAQEEEMAALAEKAAALDAALAAQYRKVEELEAAAAERATSRPMYDELAAEHTALSRRFAAADEERAAARRAADELRAEKADAVQRADTLAAEVLAFRAQLEAGVEESQAALSVRSASAASAQPGAEGEAAKVKLLGLIDYLAVDTPGSDDGETSRHAWSLAEVVSAVEAGALQAKCAEAELRREVNVAKAHAVDVDVVKARLAGWAARLGGGDVAADAPVGTLLAAVDRLLVPQGGRAASASPADPTAHSRLAHALHVLGGHAAADAPLADLALGVEAAAQGAAAVLREALEGMEPENGSVAAAASAARAALARAGGVQEECAAGRAQLLRLLKDTAPPEVAQRYVGSPSSPVEAMWSHLALRDAVDAVDYAVREVHMKAAASVQRIARAHEASDQEIAGLEDRLKQRPSPAALEDALSELETKNEVLAKLLDREENLRGRLHGVLASIRGGAPAVDGCSPGGREASKSAGVAGVLDIVAEIEGAVATQVTLVPQPVLTPANTAASERQASVAPRVPDDDDSAHRRACCDKLLDALEINRDEGAAAALPLWNLCCAVADEMARLRSAAQEEQDGTAARCKATLRTALRRGDEDGAALEELCLDVDAQLAAARSEQVLLQGQVDATVRELEALVETGEEVEDCRGRLAKALAPHAKTNRRLPPLPPLALLVAGVEEVLAREAHGRTASVTPSEDAGPLIRHASGSAQSQSSAFAGNTPRMPRAYDPAERAPAQPPALPTHETPSEEVARLHELLCAAGELHPDSAPSLPAAVAAVGALLQGRRAAEECLRQALDDAGAPSERGCLTATAAAAAEELAQAASCVATLRAVLPGPAPEALAEAVEAAAVVVFRAQQDAREAAAALERAREHQAALQASTEACRDRLVRELQAHPDLATSDAGRIESLTLAEAADEVLNALRAVAGLYAEARALLADAAQDVDRRKAALEAAMPDSTHTDGRDIDEVVRVAAAMLQGDAASDVGARRLFALLDPAVKAALVEDAAGADAPALDRVVAEVEHMVQHLRVSGSQMREEVGRSLPDPAAARRQDGDAEAARAFLARLTGAPSDGPLAQLAGAVHETAQALAWGVLRGGGGLPGSATLQEVERGVAEARRALLPDDAADTPLLVCVDAVLARVKALEAEALPVDVSGKLLARVDELEAEGEGAQQSVNALLTFLAKDTLASASPTPRGLLPALGELENCVLALRTKADAPSPPSPHHEDVLRLLRGAGWRVADGSARPTWQEMLGELEARSAAADELGACTERLATVLNYLAPGRAVRMESAAAAAEVVQKEVISLRAQVLEAERAAAAAPQNESHTHLEIERLSVELDAMRDERLTLHSALRDAQRRNPDADVELASLRGELEGLKAERDQLEQLLQSSGPAQPSLRGTPLTPPFANPRNAREDTAAAHDVSLCDSLGAADAMGLLQDAEVARLMREVEGAKEEQAYLLDAMRSASAEHEREVARLKAAHGGSAAMDDLQDHNARLTASLKAVITKSAEYESQGAAIAADADTLLRHCEQLTAGLAEATGGRIQMPFPALRTVLPALHPDEYAVPYTTSAHASHADQVSNASTGDDFSCASGARPVRRRDAPASDISFLSVEPPPPLSRKVSMDGKVIGSRYVEMESVEMLSARTGSPDGEVDRQLEASQGKVHDLEWRIKEHLASLAGGAPQSGSFAAYLAGVRHQARGGGAASAADAHALQQQLSESNGKVAALETRIQYLERLKLGVAGGATAGREEASLPAGSRGTSPSVMGLDEAATSPEALQQQVVLLRRELGALNTSHDSVLKELHRHMMREGAARSEAQEVKAQAEADAADMERAFLASLLQTPGAPLAALRDEVTQKVHAAAAAATRGPAPGGDGGGALSADGLCELLRARWRAEVGRLVQHVESMRNGDLPHDCAFVAAPMSGALLDSGAAMEVEELKEALASAYTQLGDVKASLAHPGASDPVGAEGGALAWVRWARGVQVTEGGAAQTSHRVEAHGAQECSAARWVSVEGSGWVVPDTRCLPRRATQEALMDGYARVVKERAAVDDVWGDEGCPDGVAGEGTAETLATAHERIVAVGGRVSDAVVKLCEMVGPGDGAQQAGFLADLVREAAGDATGWHPAELLLLDLYSFSHDEGATVFRSAKRDRHAAPSWWTLRTAVDMVAKTCLRGSAEDETEAHAALGGRDGVSDVASLARVYHAVVCSAAEAAPPPREVYRTVTVSHAIARDHLHIPAGSRYGWAAPARCTSAPEYRPGGEEAQGCGAPSQIYFHLTNLTQGVAVPHRPSDVLLPPFTEFEIVSIAASSPYGADAAQVPQDAPMWIYIEMDYRGCPLEAPVGSRGDIAAPHPVRKAFCDAFDDLLTSQAATTQHIDLPTRSDCPAPGGHGPGADHALAAERQKSAKLKSALAGALEGCESMGKVAKRNEALGDEVLELRGINTRLHEQLRALEKRAADPARVRELEAQVHALSKLMDDVGAGKGAADELERRNASLEVQLGTQTAMVEELQALVASLQDNKKAPRGPAVDALLELCAKIDAVRRVARDLRGAPAQKSREVAAIVAAVDDAYTKTKQVAVHALTPEERSTAPTWLAPSPASGRHPRVHSPGSRTRTPSAGRVRKR